MTQSKQLNRDCIPFRKSVLIVDCTNNKRRIKLSKTSARREHKFYDLEYDIDVTTSKHTFATESKKATKPQPHNTAAPKHWCNHRRELKTLRGAHTQIHHISERNRCRKALQLNDSSRFLFSHQPVSFVQLRKTIIHRLTVCFGDI